MAGNRGESAMMTNDDLQRIQDTVNAAIKKLHADYNANFTTDTMPPWGTPDCYEVRWWTDQGGDTGVEARLSRVRGEHQWLSARLLVEMTRQGLGDVVAPIQCNGHEARLCGVSIIVCGENHTTVFGRSLHT
jgi:hypothetical protein